MICIHLWLCITLALILFVFILFGVLGAYKTYKLMFLIKFRNASAVIASDISLIPFPLSSGSPVACMSGCIILSYGLWDFVRFYSFFFFFLIFRSDNFHWSTLSLLILSSAISNLVLNLSNKIFISNIILFKSRISSLSFVYFPFLC